MWYLQPRRLINRTQPSKKPFLLEIMIENTHPVRTHPGGPRLVYHSKHISLTTRALAPALPSFPSQAASAGGCVVLSCPCTTWEAIRQILLSLDLITCVFVLYVLGILKARRTLGAICHEPSHLCPASAPKWDSLANDRAIDGIRE